VLAQLFSHVQDLVKRRHLESDVMQFFMMRSPRAGADQRNRMMIGMTAQECKSAGLQIFGIDFSHLNPKTCV
jgi:hypothetical protein